jgi:hypothetical protein
MSCKAVVITTNAPPMNELVNSDRGVLVDYSSHEPHALGFNYHFNSDSLESKINQVLGMSNAEKYKLGKLAREWYLENHAFFIKNFLNVINNFL